MTLYIALLICAAVLGAYFLLGRSMYGQGRRVRLTKLILTVSASVGVSAWVLQQLPLGNWTWIGYVITGVSTIVFMRAGWLYERRRLAPRRIFHGTAPAIHNLFGVKEFDDASRQIQDDRGRQPTPPRCLDYENMRMGE